MFWFAYFQTEGTLFSICKLGMFWTLPPKDSISSSLASEALRPATFGVDRVALVSIALHFTEGDTIPECYTERADMKGKQGISSKLLFPVLEASGSSFNPESQSLPLPNGIIIHPAA